jgi:hypothetical protein
MRSGQVVQDELLGTLAGYDDIDRGRRVRPEGSGKDEDQEGFLFTRGGGPAQVNNPQSRYQKWGTSQEQELRTEALEDFHREHLHPMSSLGDHNQILVGCGFCSYVAQDESPRFNNSDEESDPESENEESDLMSGPVWELACDHLDNAHPQKLNKLMNENLPAWIKAHDGLPGSTRGVDKEKKCDRDHERIRREAIERKEKFKIECHCRHVIYNPDRDLK